MKKLRAMIFAMVLGVAGVLAMSETPVYATLPDVPQSADCVKSFLGLRPWYQGLTYEKDGSCEVATPRDPECNDADGDGKCISGETIEFLTIPQFVWTVILNVTADLFIIGGLLALGFIIWGGFKYIMSDGDPGKVMLAKKTIVSAVIGLIITILASVIVNTIINVLLAARGA